MLSCKGYYNTIKPVEDKAKCHEQWALLWQEERLLQVSKR